MPPETPKPNQTNPLVQAPPSAAANASVTPQTPLATPAPVLPQTSTPPAPTTPSGSPVNKEKPVERVKPTKKQLAATQNTLQISEIRDGLVIMRDGSVRAVIMCQSINFDLMSEQEKEAVESSYQSFLNSLYFDVQIFIRSERVDLGNYLEKLDKIQRDQEKVMLGLLMQDYIEYVRYLIENSNIMTKQFYVVVPYHPTLDVKSGGVLSLKALLNKKQETITINQVDYEKYKTELKERAFVVLNGLNDMNVNAVALNTQELIELYYSVYNPQTSDQEHLTNIADLESPIVTKGNSNERLIEAQTNGPV